MSSFICAIYFSWLIVFAWCEIKSCKRYLFAPLTCLYPPQPILFFLSSSSSHAGGGGGGEAGHFLRGDRPAYPSALGRGDRAAECLQDRPPGPHPRGSGKFPILSFVLFCCYQNCVECVKFIHGCKIHLLFFRYLCSFISNP